jgi:hypothetical protein
MKEYYQRYHVGKEVRGPVPYESHFFVHAKYLFQLSCYLLQIITGRDCKLWSLEFYDGTPKKVVKDERALRIHGQPVLENWNSKI